MQQAQVCRLSQLTALKVAQGQRDDLAPCIAAFKAAVEVEGKRLVLHRASGPEGGVRWCTALLAGAPCRCSGVRARLTPLAFRLSGWI